MVRMLNVSILRGATAVGASQDSLELETTVQVHVHLIQESASSIVCSGYCGACTIYVVADIAIGEDI